MSHRKPHNHGSLSSLALPICLQPSREDAKDSFSLNSSIFYQHFLHNILASRYPPVKHQMPEVVFLFQFLYIWMCMCVCVCVYIYIYISVHGIYMYNVKADWLMPLLILTRSSHCAQEYSRQEEEMVLQNRNFAVLTRTNSLPQIYPEC